MSSSTSTDAASSRADERCEVERVDANGMQHANVPQLAFSAWPVRMNSREPDQPRSPGSAMRTPPRRASELLHDAAPDESADEVVGGIGVREERAVEGGRAGVEGVPDACGERGRAERAPQHVARVDVERRVRGDVMG